MRRSMAFGEPLLCFDFILRHDVCQLQQIYAGAVLLARYSMHPEPYQSVSEGANCIASPAKWFPCMYAIDPDTFAGYCIVSLPLPGALHNFTCSSILHMMLSTCSVMLLCDLCFAAAGWVQMTYHGQLNHMAILAVGVDTISKQCSSCMSTSTRRDLPAMV